MERIRLTKNPSVLLWLLVLLIALIAACSAPPTTAEDPATTEAPAAGDTSPTETSESAPEEITRAETIEEVYAALEGLEGEERDARLLELARAEEDTEFLLYFSVNEGIEWIEGFEEETGLVIDFFQSSQNNVLERALQEHEAGFREGADVILLGTPELVAMENEGMFVDLHTPYSDAILPDLVDDQQIGVYLSTTGPAWNTSVERPADWVSLLESAPNLVIEASDWDYFATLVLDYMVPELGMTEEEAIDLWEQAARRAAGASGHTFSVQMAISGEYDVSVWSHITRVQEFEQEGAPIAWQPAIEPHVNRPNGVAIHHFTDRPATSLLLVDWFLTGAQEIMLTQNTVPANTEVGGEHPALQVDLLSIRGFHTPDFDSDLWQQIWEDRVVNNFTEVLEEEE